MKRNEFVEVLENQLLKSGWSSGRAFQIAYKIGTIPSDKTFENRNELKLELFQLGDAILETMSNDIS